MHLRATSSICSTKRTHASYAKPATTRAAVLTSSRALPRFGAEHADCQEITVEAPVNAPSFAAKACAALATAAVLTCGAGSADAIVVKGLTSSDPVFDGANIIPAESQKQLTEKLQDFEQRTGWRIRIFTNYPAEAPDDSQLREQWGPDKRSVFLQVDPTAPNILNFRQIGDEVLLKLRRPFWSELQGRFGNLFYVRDEGELSAIQETVGAVTTCLAKPEGCKVVPGVSSEEYALTLAMAVAAGLTAGSVYRLELSGFITQRWQWLLVFSPLWGPLLVNFALAPLLTRTDDIAPIAANLAAFAVTAALPNVLANMFGVAPLKD